MDEEPIEVTFLVGEWVPTREFAQRLRAQQEQDESQPEPEDD
jgi:hypothetical protein